ncbi:MAG: hypothetical protein BWY74_00151 [Firmicutes bacterium ADurb.Bin419]|nr:MAG: hypothetical protein BWY74_00151 [Firmicutes bacterium ADurb.Bin419]
MKTLDELLEEKKQQEKSSKENKTSLLQTVGLMSSLREVKKQTKIAPTKGFLSWFRLVFNDFGSFLQKVVFKSKVVNLDEITKSVDKLGGKTLNVEVKNQIDLTKQFDSVSRNIEKLQDKLSKYVSAVEKSIKKIKFPEPKDFPDKIAITNKKIDVSVDNLDELKKSISGTNRILSAINSIVSSKEYPNEIKISNLAELNKHFENISKSVEAIEFPQVDVSSIVLAVKAVKQTINDLKFPVPNFKSSYEHSLAMRLKNAPKEFTYDGDDLAYVEATHMGITYRKTFTYSDGKLISATDWEEQ